MKEQVVAVKTILFTIIAILLLVSALFSLKVRPTWRAALLTLPATLAAALLLLFLQQKLLALALLFCGGLNGTLFTILAIRTEAELVRPRPFRPYGGALGLVALVLVVYAALRLGEILPLTAELVKKRAPLGNDLDIATFLGQNPLIFALIGLYLLIATIGVVICASKEEKNG